ncbi:MAG TPA: hypothetical protein VEA38_12930 [Terriglobales bacterium]|nr:hypothetical protein [Terriglobales bacterium]
MNLDQSVAVDGIRQFLKLHHGCGGVVFDTPSLPSGTGYRAVAACRCGDTVEYWLTHAVIPPHHLTAAVGASYLPEAA